MATLNAYRINKLAGVREQETFWWQTAESGGAGAANGDTINLLEMPFAYAHVCFQAKGAFPASTVISLVGGVTDDVADAAPILDAAGVAITLTADNDLAFLTGGVPPWLGFTITGGTAGDIDVYCSRKYI